MGACCKKSINVEYNGAVRSYKIKITDRLKTLQFKIWEDLKIPPIQQDLSLGSGQVTEADLFKTFEDLGVEPGKSIFTLKKNDEAYKGSLEIICPGWPKGGTSSLMQALQFLGYNIYHGTHIVTSHSKSSFYAKHMKTQSETGVFDKEELKSFFEKYKIQAAADFVAYRPWRELHELYPDAKVILMEREPAKLLKSVQSYMPTLRYTIVPVFGCLCCSSVGRILDELEKDIENMYSKDPEDMKKVYEKIEAHNAAIKKTVPAEQLLTFSVKQGWEPLCEFLGCEVPDVPFPWANAGTGVLKKALKDFAIIIFLIILAIVLGIFVAWWIAPICCFMALCYGLYFKYKIDTFFDYKQKKKKEQ